MRASRLRRSIRRTPLDEIAISAVHGRDDVESGRIDVAGLDPIDPSHARAVIGGADGMTAEKTKTRVEKKAVVAREAFLDGAAEDRLVARAW